MLAPEREADQPPRAWALLLPQGSSKQREAAASRGKAPGALTLALPFTEIVTGTCIKFETALSCSQRRRASVRVNMEEESLQRQAQAIGSSAQNAIAPCDVHAGNRKLCIRVKQRKVMCMLVGNCLAF